MQIPSKNVNYKKQKIWMLCWVLSQFWKFRATLKLYHKINNFLRAKLSIALYSENKSNPIFSIQALFFSYLWACIKKNIKSISLSCYKYQWDSRIRSRWNIIFVSICIYHNQNMNEFETDNGDAVIIVGVYGAISFIL